MVVEATLCEIIHGGRLLLQRKSAGRFGEGKWNGPGGKIQYSHPQGTHDDRFWAIALAVFSITEKRRNKPIAIR